MLGLIVGGAGSGKSEYAEQLAVQLSEKTGGERIYLATMVSGGKEAGERIARHRKNRAGRGFRTVERPVDLCGLDLRKEEGALPAVLLEDLGNLLGNEMFLPEGGGAEAVFDGIRHMQEQAGDLIVVGNEVFSDGAVYDEGTQAYLRELAQIQRRLAERADLVAEVVCGCAHILKKRNV